MKRFRFSMDFQAGKFRDVFHVEDLYFRLNDLPRGGIRVLWNPSFLVRFTCSRKDTCGGWWRHFIRSKSRGQAKQESQQSTRSLDFIIPHTKHEVHHCHPFSHRHGICLYSQCLTNTLRGSYCRWRKQCFGSRTRPCLWNVSGTKVMNID